MSTKVSTSVPAPTAAEQALTARQVELAEFQLGELRKQSAAQDAFAEEITPFLEAQTVEAERQAERARTLEPIQDEVLQIQLEDLRRGGAASPEQQARIDEAADEALAAGSVDIERFRTQSLDALREELAPGLGLRPSDSPILDRGARVAAEATRQGGQLSSTLRSAAASGKINLGLATSQLTQASGLGLQQVTEATRQFQENLRQQAFSNRLAVSGQQAGIGLGLAGNPAGTLQSALSPLTQSRLAGTSQTTSGLGQFIGPAIGAVGAGLGAFAASSREFKEDIRSIDEAAALEAVERLDIATWQYKPEMGLGLERHAGPMAEDMKGLGLSDGTTVQPMDSAGLSLAATKELARKVRRLELAA